MTFLIADYMYTMFDSGALQPQWGDWRFDPDVLEEFDLSDTALSFVEARLKRLGDEANSLIEVAAVIGHRVDLSLLSHVCELETSEVLAGIERAVQLNILERDGVEYVFAHDRLQDTLLAHIDEARRDQLHLRVARILDETLERSQRDLYAIASHYLEGGPERAPESAFEALCRAGHAALDSFAPAQAHLYLDRARELAETHASLEFDLDDHEALGTAC